MNKPAAYGGKLLSWTAMVACLLFLALACGPGAEPTPTTTTAPTATPTKVPGGVTPTPTKPATVATPTPTTVGAPTPTPGVQPKKGGTLRFAHGTFTPTFDPQLLSVSPEYFQSTGKLYTNLFVNYEGQTTECEICSAEGWHLENNGKTMVLNIQPGIKFHSGQELIAADVAYSIKMIIGEIDGIVSPRAGVLKEYVESVDAPSKYVVRINLIRPSPFVPKILAVSAAAIYRAGITRDDLKKADSGAGPFIVKNIVQGASWQLVRNPDYFKKGQPYLDAFEITIIPDATTRIASLLTHKIDWGGTSNKQYEAKLTELEKAGQLTRILELGGCGPRFTAFNLQKPPFNDIKMRQAVNLGLDRTAIATAGLGEYIQGWVPQLLHYNPGMEYATPPEKIWNIVPGWGTGAKKQQEIDQAKQLVKDAGFPNGIDDVDQMARGPLSTFSYLAPEEVQQELSKIGIRTKISVALADQNAERMANLNYQLQVYEYCMITRDSDEVVGQYWITGGARNWVGYSNPEVDKLFIQMSSEADPVKRRDLFFKIQDIIVLKDIGYAPIASNNGLSFLWSNVHGFTVGMSIHSASGWHRGDRVWLGSQ